MIESRKKSFTSSTRAGFHEAETLLSCNVSIELELGLGRPWNILRLSFFFPHELQSSSVCLKWFFTLRELVGEVILLAQILQRLFFCVVPFPSGPKTFERSIFLGLEVEPAGVDDLEDVFD